MDPQGCHNGFPFDGQILHAPSSRVLRKLTTVRLILFTTYFRLVRINVCLFLEFIARLCVSSSPSWSHHKPKNFIESKKSHTGIELVYAFKIVYLKARTSALRYFFGQDTTRDTKLRPSQDWTERIPYTSGLQHFRLTTHLFYNLFFANLGNLCWSRKATEVLCLNMRLLKYWSLSDWIDGFEFYFWSFKFWSRQFLIFYLLSFRKYLDKPRRLENKFKSVFII